MKPKQLHGKLVGIEILSELVPETEEIS